MALRQKITASEVLNQNEALHTCRSCSPRDDACIRARHRIDPLMLVLTTALCVAPWALPGLLPLLRVTLPSCMGYSIRTAAAPTGGLLRVPPALTVNL